jgi:hypothetical protein
MRGLSLTQPWATLVAIGAKTIETRSWSTPYRGELLIAAALRFPFEARERCWHEPFLTALVKAGHTTTQDLRTGVILCVAELYDCVPTEDVVDRDAFGDYGPNRFAWLLRNVRPLRPPIPSAHVTAKGRIKAGGALGLWSVPQVVLDLVAGQGVL